MIDPFHFDEGGSAGRRGKIATRSRPKAGVEKIVEPGRIVSLRAGAVASRTTGIGIAFAPIP